MNNIRCEECGRFCVPVDNGTYYGSVTDLEPPEPSFFCKKCVIKKLKEPNKIIVNCWWLKPNFVSVSKSIARHNKKISV